MFLVIIYCFILIFSFLFFIRVNYLGYVYSTSSADDSIYTQALKLINWDNINPFISIRQIHIFNDHFDLIIIPLSILAKIFPPLAVVYFYEIFFLFLSCCFLFYIYKKKEILMSVLVMSTMILIMSEPIFMAILFPAHPITWSVFPLVLVCYFIFKDNDKGVIFSYLFLLLFKEIYVLTGFSLVLIYIFRKKYRISFVLLLLTAFWCFMVFYGRYLIWDYPSIHYQNRIKTITDIFYDFFFGHKVIQHNILIFFPLVFFYIHAFKKNIRLDWTIFLLILPLWMMNLIMGKNLWNVHRVVFFSPIIAMSIVFLFKNQKISKKVIVSFLCFFMLIHIERFIKYSGFNVSNIRHIKTWEERKIRNVELAEILKYFKNYKKSNIFTQSTFMGRLLEHNSQYTFYYSAGFSKLRDKDYYKSYKGINKDSLNDFLFLEKIDDYKEYVASFKNKYNSETVFDTKYFIVEKKSSPHQ